MSRADDRFSPPSSARWGVLALLSVLLCLASPAARAEVVAAGAQGFQVRHQVELAAEPAEVFERLSRIGEWWDPAHTFSKDAKALSLDPRPRGCFCEALEGGGVVHLGVIHAVPGQRLILEGGLGPLQGLPVTGKMVWELEDLAPGTRLSFRYGVAGFVDGGLESWAGPVDGVVRGQLERFARWLGTGSPEAAGVDDSGAASPQGPEPGGAGTP